MESLAEPASVDPRFGKYTLKADPVHAHWCSVILPLDQAHFARMPLRSLWQRDGERRS
jgi:hypothetical protein